MILKLCVAIKIIGESYHSSLRTSVPNTENKTKKKKREKRNLYYSCSPVLIHDS